jgi:opacity protein-like surface antigen
MTENQFDEFFRKKLENYSSQVPEDMWQRIKQKKDKERRIIILLVLLLLMAGGATSYFIFWGKKNPDKENIASSQKHTNRNTDSSVTDQNKKDETIITQTDTTSFKEENKNSLSHNDIAIQSIHGLNKGYATPKNNNSELSNLQIKKNNDNNNEEVKNNLDAVKHYQQNLLENPADSSANNFLNQITIKPDADISVKKNEGKISPLQKDSSLKEDQNAKVSIVIKNDGPAIDKLFLEVYLSPDIPFNKTSSANTAYLQHKDSTSKMQLSYTVGLKLSALFGNHISGKIGFQYSQINEKFNYKNKNAIRTVPVVIQRSLPDATGAIRTVLDTSDLIQAGTQYKLTYNHYRSIDIPLLIGYETSGDRFKAAFNTGIILNIKTSYSGDILDASLNPVDINSNNVYKSNTGVSLYFGLGLATRLNNSFQLFTEPYIRYRLNNMTGTYQSFRQKTNVGGLSFGLRYNFKK